MIWFSNAINELRYFFPDADTPTTPIATATVTVTLSRSGVVIGAADRSMAYSSSLVVEAGYVGGYLVAFTAAEITATGGDPYIAVIDAKIGGVLQDRVELSIRPIVNTGS